MKKIKITVDANPNQRRLRKLLKKYKDKLDIYQVPFENITKKIKNKTNLKSRIDIATKLSTVEEDDPEDDKNIELLRRILGKNNWEDAVQVLEHINSGNDFFVTNDKGILNKKEELNKAFPKLRFGNIDDLEELLKENE